MNGPEPIYGRVPSHWKMTTVGQLIDKGVAELQTGPFGTMLQASEYQDTGTPVVAVQHIADNRILHHDLPKIAPDTESRLSGYKLALGDIVFGRKGAVDRRALIRAEESGWLQGSDCIRLRLQGDVVDPFFISSLLGTSAYRNWIVQHAHGATMPSLNQEILRLIPLALPPIAEQREIARFLSLFEDKIALNRSMNNTLEAIGQALFTSWFVDFDPIRANAEGREPEKISKQVAAWFPTRFQDSQLGRIPEGWSVKTIRDVASSIQYGLTTSGCSEPAGPKFLRITDIQGGRVNWEKVPYCRASLEDQERYRLKPHDILVARTGASTGENVYLPSAPTAVFASYLVRFQFDDPALARFVGEFMRTPSYFDYIAGCLGGSAQPNASAQLLASVQLAVPTDNILARFAAVMRPIDSRRTANSEESARLSAMRDTLLPKLISGEVGVRRSATIGNV